MRVQRRPVSQKRVSEASSAAKNRRLLSTGVILLCIAITGFLLGRSSLFPLLGSIFKSEQAPAQNVTTPVVDSEASKKAELETRAKGYELVLQRQP